jgi:nucleosome binding factor SPN SPT16 subunit
VPYRELGFQGTPLKSNVDIYPCRDSICALNEWPVFIHTLQEVEFVYFERVSFGLRNFDLVFIPKDYSKPVTRISAIPITSLDNIKAWLTEIKLVYYEGPTNMNWTNIIKEVNKDRKSFANGGSWDAYFGESDGEEGGEGGEDSDDDDDSEFAESDDEDGDEDEEEDDSDDSDVSSLVSDEEDEDGEGSLDSDESEGLDWDELEKKAEREDREKAKKRGRDDDEDEARKRRKK